MVTATCPGRFESGDAPETLPAPKRVTQGPLPLQQVTFGAAGLGTEGYVSTLCEIRAFNLPALSLWPDRSVPMAVQRQLYVYTTMFRSYPAYAPQVSHQLPSFDAINALRE